MFAFAQSVIARFLGIFLDLKLMGERLRQRYYINVDLFVADMRRIFYNCRTYNLPDSDLYRAAATLDAFFGRKLKESGLSGTS